MINDAILGVGATCFALSGVWTYIADNVLPDETAIQTRLLETAKYLGKSAEAAGAAHRRKQIQRGAFFILWIAGLVLSILALLAVGVSSAQPVK